MLIAPDLEIFITQDGSPTLILRNAQGVQEKMHHTGGALSESLYIYHYGLHMALNEGCPARVISVGLGLAYNELIALAEFHKRGIEGQIWSFEVEEQLQSHFSNWTRGAAGEVYDQISSGIEKHFQIEGLRQIAAQALDSGHLSLRGAFPQMCTGVTDAGVVFYDAFSNKMSPELWQENEIAKSLRPLLASKSLLCTYAATGALNRALRQLDFRQITRSGFQGKRESTLAIRG